MKAIPIAPAKEAHAALRIAAFDGVAKALADGDLVAIFPEDGLPTPASCTFPAGNFALRRTHAGAGRADGVARTSGCFFSRKGGW